MPGIFGWLDNEEENEEPDNEFINELREHWEERFAEERRQRAREFQERMERRREELANEDGVEMEFPDIEENDAEEEFHVGRGFIRADDIQADQPRNEREVQAEPAMGEPEVVEMDWGNPEPIRYKPYGRNPSEYEKDKSKLDI